MRLSFVVSSVVVSVVAISGVYACGGESSSSHGGADVPEGGSVLEDGAVVNADGELVEPPDSKPVKPSKVIATNETVTVMGNTRTYVLAVPKSYDAARRYPLIVAMHGDGQDAAGFRAFVPLDDLAGEDAIVAYTNGAEDLFTPYDQNPDQQLIEATIDAVKAKYSVDGGKVWGFGYSKGGFMANEIACRKPGLFTAMAVHASGAPQEPQMNGFPVCPGVIGLPVLVTEGEFDTGIGGDYGAQYWASINGCSNQRSATTPAPCLKHDNCPAGKPVVYCLAPAVAHYPIWERAAEVSWAFFKGL